MKNESWTEKKKNKRDKEFLIRPKNESIDPLNLYVSSSDKKANFRLFNNCPSSNKSEQFA